MRAVNLEVCFVGRLTFVCLGSVGTYGHLALVSEVARAATALTGGDGRRTQVDVITETSDMPAYFREPLDRVTTITERPQACSRGGRLHEEYSGTDVDRAFAAHAGGTWVFSTFFREEWVTRARASGARCVWMGYPMRDSSWNLFHLEQFDSLFDEIIVLDDVHSPRLLHQMNESSRPTRRLPPPVYATNQLSARRTRSAAQGGVRALVACGGGVVNDTGPLFVDMVRSITDIPGAEISVLPGYVDVDHFDTAEGAVVRVVDGPLDRHLDDTDLVVCQAGYHTVHEILLRGVPAVVVPSPRVIDDQELRAVALAAATGTGVVLPSELHRLCDVVSDAARSDAWRTSVSRAMTELVLGRGWDDAAAQWTTWLHAQSATPRREVRTQHEQFEPVHAPAETS